MPKLIVQNLFDKEVYVASGQKVLAAIQEAGLDWMHACGAKGRCTTCRILVREGLAGFGPLSPAEERYRAQNRLQENERLTCQCLLSSDASGLVPEQTKFPHMTYSF
jgi:ferredoxin, 2Fe-2S